MLITYAVEGVGFLSPYKRTFQGSNRRTCKKTTDVGFNCGCFRAGGYMLRSGRAGQPGARERLELAGLETRCQSE